MTLGGVIMLLIAIYEHEMMHIFWLMKIPQTVIEFYWKLGGSYLQTIKFIYSGWGETESNVFNSEGDFSS